MYHAGTWLFQNYGFWTFGLFNRANKIVKKKRATLIKITIKKCYELSCIDKYSHLDANNYL